MRWFKQSAPNFDGWMNYDPKKPFYNNQKTGHVSLFKQGYDRITRKPSYVVESRLFIAKSRPYPHFNKVMDETRHYTTYKGALKSAKSFKAKIGKMR